MENFRVIEVSNGEKRAQVRDPSGIWQFISPGSNSIIAYETQFGIQIEKDYGIMQVIYDTSLFTLHTTLRKHLTDRYPVFKHEVPSGENHTFQLVLENNRNVAVGHLVMDADSYGEVEVFQGLDLYFRLRKHHQSLGLRVLPQGELVLAPKRDV